MSENTPNVEPRFGVTGSIAPEYFDQLYANNPDPWDFLTSRYEADKYRATIDALPRQYYSNALELGCSIGVLTEQLASRCRKLLATDVCEIALAQARLRCAHRLGVTFQLCDLSISFPGGQFDLILLSEVGYYLSLLDLELLRARVAKSLKPGGDLVLVHYTGATNYPLTADAVHETFLAWEDQVWKLTHARRSNGYRLDVFQRGSEARQFRLVEVGSG